MAATIHSSRLWSQNYISTCVINILFMSVMLHVQFSGKFLSGLMHPSWETLKSTWYCVFLAHNQEWDIDVGMRHWCGNGTLMWEWDIDVGIPEYFDDTTVSCVSATNGTCHIPSRDSSVHHNITEPFNNFSFSRSLIKRWWWVHSKSCPVLYKQLSEPNSYGFGRMWLWILN